MPHSHFAAELRKADPDRFLLSLFAPARAREELWALYLFNYEIAKTREVVSDTNLGLIRLQWWRDEIGKLYEGGTGGQNPILSTIGQAIQKHDLPLEHFETLIYAREFDLEDTAPANLEGLRHYADFTTSPLTSLSLKIIGERSDQDEIREISVNYGLLGLMRNVPFMLSQGRCYLPQDLLNDKNLTPKKIIDFNYKEEILEILQLIQPSFDSYRKPKSGHLGKMRGLTQIYLKHLQKHNFNVFSAKMQVPPPFLGLRLFFK